MLKCHGIRFNWIQKILFTRNTWRISIQTFIGSGMINLWLRQSRFKKSLKSHRLHEQNVTFLPVQLFRVANCKPYETVIEANQRKKSQKTVGNVSCRSINDWVIPVKFLQKSLSVGNRIGRTYLWNSDSVRPVVVFIRTAGNSTHINFVFSC